MPSGTKANASPETFEKHDARSKVSLEEGYIFLVICIRECFCLFRFQTDRPFEVSSKKNKLLKEVLPKFKWEETKGQHSTI